MAATLKDCAPGEEVTFNNVVGKLVTKTDKDAVVDVTDLEYVGGESEPSGDSEDVPEADALPAPKKSKPAVSKLGEMY